MIVGLGSDLVEISRIDRAILRHRDRFLNRIFTKEEQEYCLMKKSPAIHFAGRFALKEAFFKAFQSVDSHFVLSWIDMSVKRVGGGRPIFVGTDRLNHVITDLSIKTHITITHSKSLAFSTVLLEQ